MDRLTIARDVLARLGKYRACEAGKQQASAIENPLGPEYIGVDDWSGKTWRARIRVCDALTGHDKRVTLGRYEYPEDAAYAYRVAHVALYGSYSWAAGSLSAGERYIVDLTRKSA